MRVTRVLRAPAFHFVSAGAALFALHAWRVAVAPPLRAPIVVARADVDRLRHEWALQHGAPPGARTVRALIDRAIDDEILYREAVARGLDRQDRLVRTRLARLAGFVDEGGDAGNGTGELEEAARRLGLDRNDVVIRRHLVHTMRLLVSAPAPPDRPTERELAADLERHAGSFAQPPRVSLAHVYLRHGGRGGAPEHEARRLLAQLRRDGRPPEAAATLGDPFVHGSEVIGASRREIEGIFGPGFAAAIDALPAGVWAGPVRSSYGLHLVWIRERPAATRPLLAAVRGRVRQRWLAERRRERLHERLGELRRRYEIRIAPDVTALDPSS
jgi:hypothetical protein